MCMHLILHLCTGVPSPTSWSSGMGSRVLRLPRFGLNIECLWLGVAQAECSGLCRRQVEATNDLHARYPNRGCQTPPHALSLLPGAGSDRPLAM